jgi:Ca2+-binding RTX toxin-like protein
MTTYTYASDVTAAAPGTPLQQLADGDTMIVDPGVTLQTTGLGSDLVDGTGGATLSLAGTLLSSHDGVVFDGGGGNHIAVAETGILQAFGVAVDIVGPGNEITNDGTIYGNTGIVLWNGGNDIENAGFIGANNDGWAIDLVSTAGETNAVHNTGSINQQFGLNAIRGGDGVDTIVNSGTINGAVSLGAGDDRFDNVHGTSIGVVDGGAGDDVLLGGRGQDRFSGGAGDDILKGYSGADALDGGSGHNTLTGGAGADTFYFSVFGSGTVDRITDFTPGQDLILIDHIAFQDSHIGAFPAGELQIGPAAADADDRFIYDDTSGKLYFDPDGNGIHSQHLIAVLTTGLALTAGDFMFL